MATNREKEILLFFLKDKNKKNLFQIIREFSTLLLSKKEIPLYYISNLLYRKNVDNYQDYLSLKENNKILNWSYSFANDQIKFALNKLLFEELLNKNNIPTPRIFFYNSKNDFTYNNTTVNINSKNDFFRFLERVFSEIDVEHMFCKPIDGGKGKNIFALSKKSFKNISDDQVTKVLSGSFIFQEKVEQHEALNGVNASSLNTLRITTFKNPENEVEMLSGFIRIGRKGAIIDNAHAGGIALPIHNETGKLHAEGIQLIDNGGGVFYKHPDSGVSFKNFQIPHFNEVKTMVARASLLFDFPLLGWDVAITPSGPIIIEVNHNFHLLLSDRLAKGLKRNPSFKKIFDSVI